MSYPPATQAQALLTRDAPPAYRVTVVGGVPTYWRTLNNDSQTDPAWAAVYRRYNVINPWLVGRFADDAGVDNYRTHVLVGDLAEAARVGADYMPVVWPGFSRSNLMPGQALNQIPRRGGAFWWKQLSTYQSAGCSMFFGAMFDEVDEGTAMFKIAAHHADAPSDASFLTLDADGMNLPSDWYLRLAGAGSQMIRGEIPRTTTVPITP